MNLLPVPRYRRADRRAGAEPRDRADASTDRSPPQGYELRIDGSGVELVGGDDAGRFYGEATLAQLARLHDGALPVGPSATIPTSPCAASCSTSLATRCRRWQTLEALIDRLASWKVNQVQLYSRAHVRLPQPRRGARAPRARSRADEIRELDAFCRARHVELVPNQNCLGHMNRWLQPRPLPAAGHRARRLRRPVRHHPTADDARTREPRIARARPRAAGGAAPAVLEPPRPHRPRRGVGAARRARIDDFLSWVATLRALPELDDREMMMWGDMFSGHPDLVATLPAGVTVCEWGYDDWYPFDERCARTG